MTEAFTLPTIQLKKETAVARLPRYCKLIDTYREEVESYLSASYGNRQCEGIRQNLLRTLSHTLFTGKVPRDDLPERKLKTILRKIERTMAEDDYRIARAWYENRTYGASRRTSAFRWRVHPKEIKYLEELWTELRYSRDEYRKMLEKARIGWQFAVDEVHEEVAVWLDDRAIEDIVLVALEAYAVPKGKGVRFTETYGMCFGSTKATEEKRQALGKHITRYIYINSVHIQLRAEGYSNKLIYDLRSLETQMAVARHLFPQLDIVGDFHTHPYRDVEELKLAKGWLYSTADEASIPSWASPLRKMGYHPRTSLIVAIAKGGRRIKRPSRLRPNVIRFSIDKYHFYVACFRIIGNRYSDKHITINSGVLPGM